jgi:hypothetical protein
MVGSSNRCAKPFDDGGRRCFGGPIGIGGGISGGGRGRLKDVVETVSRSLRSAP